MRTASIQATEKKKSQPEPEPELEQHPQEPEPEKHPQQVWVGTSPSNNKRNKASKKKKEEEPHHDPNNNHSHNNNVPPPRPPPFLLRPPPPVPAVPVPPPPGWDRCHAYLPRKRRFCRQEPVPPGLEAADETSDGARGDAPAPGPCALLPRYCGNHRHWYRGSPPGSHRAGTAAAVGAAGTGTGTGAVAVAATPGALSGSPASRAAAAATEDPHGSGPAGTMTAKTTTVTTVTTRKRVPCPWDPSHTIWEDQWDRHKVKCPKVARQQRQQGLDCYRFDCNRGGCGRNRFDAADDDDDAADTFTGDGDGDGSSEARQPAVPTISAVGALSLARRVMHVYQSREGAVPPKGDIALVDMSTPQLVQELRLATEHYRIKTGGAKHRHQHASLIGHVRRAVVVGDNAGDDDDGTPPCRGRRPPPLTVLEMGAGRGVTGVLVAGVMNCAPPPPPPPCESVPPPVSSTRRDVRLVMVDRGGSRGKADTVLRRATSMEPSPYLDLRLSAWRRVTCDLNHLYVPTLLDAESDNTNNRDSSVTGDEKKLAEVSGDQLMSACDTAAPQQAPTVVVIAKHLCGSGTDVALKSLLDVRHRLRACAFATCCHGLCTWHDYVGRDFLGGAMTGQNGEWLGTPTPAPVLPSFGRQEFDLMARWSAGTASCGHKAPHGPGNGAENREEGVRTSMLKENFETGSYGNPTELNTSTGNEDPFNVVKIAESIGVEPGDLGRACQRLIDFGRRDFLGTLFAADAPTTLDSPSCKSSVELVHYVPPEVTPQNALLLAWR